MVVSSKLLEVTAVELLTWIEKILQLARTKDAIFA
jgi:hypothetical protein